MAVDVSQVLVDFIHKILTDPATAFQFASDGHGSLAAQGVSDGDLSNLNMPALVEQACQSPDVPAETRSALQNYTSGQPSGGGPVSPPPSNYTSSQQSLDQVVQHLNYVTYVAYEGDENIEQTIIDQSTDINVGDDFSGDIDVHNAAADDGSVAGSGHGDVTGATGDGSQAINDSLIGQNQNASPGAVQAGDDINAPVNTGVNTGIIADGDVDDAVVGDHNQTVQNDAPVADSVFNFGAGDVSQINDSALNETAVATGGGDATNISDNDLQGSAISTGGDAAGEYSDDDEQVAVQAGHDSQVAVEQGHGDQHAEQHEDQPEPVHP